jgi:guanosine-3',5'-bis(diphosphate) 3'-pyrophosphohydrolase
LYETQLGDGRFHYLHSVHLSREKALAANEEFAGEWSAYHLRTATIRLRGGVFDFPNFDVKLFDHHNQAEVLVALEDLLESTQLNSGETTMATLEAAIALAVEAHKSQTDKAGSPYILHPLRVMFAVTTDYERMAAVMHDVVEDTSVTLEDLREAGFPEAVVSAVQALSRREGESYNEFVRRAAGHPIARAVKLADIEDNMDVRRLDAVDEKTVSRMKRYHDAWKILISES